VLLLRWTPSPIYAAALKKQSNVPLVHQPHAAAPPLHSRHLLVFGVYFIPLHVRFSCDLSLMSSSSSPPTKGVPSPRPRPRSRSLSSPVRDLCSSESSPPSSAMLNRLDREEQELLSQLAAVEQHRNARSILYFLPHRSSRVRVMMVITEGSRNTVVRVI
jgi:hypothetical protein